MAMAGFIRAWFGLSFWPESHTWGLTLLDAPIWFEIAVVSFIVSVGNILLGLLAVVVLGIHAWWLPSKGMNGWTAEPRNEYHKPRGWSD